MCCALIPVPKSAVAALWETVKSKQLYPGCHQTITQTHPRPFGALLGALLQISLHVRPRLRPWKGPCLPLLPESTIGQLPTESPLATVGFVSSDILTEIEILGDSVLRSALLFGSNWCYAGSHGVECAHEVITQTCPNPPRDQRGSASMHGGRNLQTTVSYLPLLHPFVQGCTALGSLRPPLCVG